MRRVQASSLGPLDALGVVEGPDFRPGPGEVVIDVEAAGVNFVDALLVQGLYQVKPDVPYTPGTEAAGRIESIGAGVDGFDIGQRVVALLPSGGYATQVRAAAHSLIVLPDAVSAASASSIIQSYGTSMYALSKCTTVAAGESVVVLGAGGGIGLAAVDLASMMGADVVACASSPEKLELARSAGATTVIDYGTDQAFDLKSAIREATGGGANVVVDPIGGDKAEQALRALAWCGRFLVIGFAAGEIPRIALNLLLLGNRSAIGVAWGFWIIREPEANSAMMSTLMEAVATGKLHPVEPVEYRLEDAAEVLDDLQQRRIAGKVVLVPSE